MSRRRPIQKPPRSDATEIRVVCTDKGQHAELSFGHVVVSKISNGWLVKPVLQHRGDEYTETVEVPDREPLPDPVRELADRLRKTYPVKCRRCGRDTPLRIDTLEKIFAAMAEADMLTLDISDLS